MFQNYFKTAWRNLWKNKAFSLINIMGLALGVTCGLVIMLWVADEYGVDGFHKNGERLYSVYIQQFHSDGVDAYYGGSGMLAAEMKRVLPEVQYAVNMDWDNLNTFEANHKILKQNGLHAGEDFFKLFSYPLLEGNATSALKNPDAISISKKMAEAFFGSAAAAFGQTIRFQNTKQFTITAVFDDFPQNSTMQFDYLINYQDIAAEDWVKDWGNSGQPCYILLRQGTDAKAFAAKIARFLDTYDQDQNEHSYKRLGIQNYGEVYLHSHFDKSGNISGGKIQYVQLFTLVAVFILLIACINFMNLTTARSVKRAKEIGIRKAIGAVRWALIRQFIGEAWLIVGLAVLVSFLLVPLALPYFNQLTGKAIPLPFGSLNFWLSIITLVALTGIIAGSYPALYLSSFKPVSVLKGVSKFSSSAVWFRKGLVVFQFMLSIVLIVGTIVVNKQVKYIQTTNLGYDKENLLLVPLEGDLIEQYPLFKNQLLNQPGIKDVTRTTDNLVQILNGTTGVEWQGKDPNRDSEFAHAAIGYDFVKTMRLELAQGRDFSKDFATDSVGYLLNESAAKIIGFQNPVGQALTLWGNPGTIIGVLKDFHFNSMHEQIRPMILRYGENTEWGRALVRTEPGQTQAALASLEKVCKALNPKFPFTYQFSDEEYAKLYQSEQVVSKLANYFAFLGIFISCLGLLGLVTFTAEQRTKEIGVRKVLGASVSSVVALLSTDFLKLVFIALLIASPLAYYLMQRWLADFAYRINMEWWMFVLAGLLAVGIALLTVSYQSIKAALMNPVKSLRSE